MHATRLECVWHRAAWGVWCRVVGYNMVVPYSELVWCICVNNIGWLMFVVIVMQLMKFISQLVTCNILKLGGTTLLDALGVLLGLMVSNLTMKKRVQEWYRWCSRIVKHDEPITWPNKRHQLLDQGFPRSACAFFGVKKTWSLPQPPKPAIVDLSSSETRYIKTLTPEIVPRGRGF